MEGDFVRMTHTLCHSDSTVQTSSFKIKTHNVEFSLFKFFREVEPKVRN